MLIAVLLGLGGISVALYAATGSLARGAAATAVVVLVALAALGARLGSEWRALGSLVERDGARLAVEVDGPVPRGFELVSGGGVVRVAPASAAGPADARLRVSADGDLALDPPSIGIRLLSTLRRLDGDAP